MRRRSGGFTLVELLVVIGILAILISLLLPAIRAAKHHAETVYCSTRLRELTSAALLHGQEHRGFLPLAGEITIPHAPMGKLNGFPAELNDAMRRRYTYSTDTMNTMYTLVPLPGALAPYLGVKDLPFDDWDKLDQRLNDLDVRVHFACPATDMLDRGRDSSNPNDNTITGQGVMVIIFSEPFHSFLSGWATNSDYAMNEGVMGYHWNPIYSSTRMRGNLSGIAGHGDQVVLFSDAKPRKQIAYGFRPWICWTPSLYSDGCVTLGDALDNTGKAADSTMFDMKRHNGRMNISFADGHVQTVPITSSELRNVYLLPPGAAVKSLVSRRIGNCSFHPPSVK